MLLFFPLRRRARHQSAASLTLAALGWLSLVTTAQAQAPTFAAQRFYATGNRPNSVAIADVDLDANPDLVVANSAGNTVSVLLAANPLPVQLVAFTATPVGPAAVRLAWTTASEVNSAAFEAERSVDGVAYDKIGTVAAAGTSSAAHRYELLTCSRPNRPPMRPSSTTA